MPLPMESANFDKPKIYPSLPAEMFRKVELLNALNRNQTSLATWARDGEPETELDEALIPMFDAVQEAVPNVEEIRIESFTNPVHPAYAQIGAAGMWHWDGHVRYMMAASDLPTKVLYVPDDAISTNHEEALSTIRAAEYARWNLDQTTMEEAIAKGTFAVLHAHEYGMIDMDRMIHQSPMNETKRTIYRTFLRAEVIESHSLAETSR